MQADTLGAGPGRIASSSVGGGAAKQQVRWPGQGERYRDMKDGESLENGTVNCPPVVETRREFLGKVAKSI